jgi:DNA replication and repair protein RecF
MHLSHLSLTHFRNYQRLELDFTRRLTLLQGPNAQGKTNLLEALYFLATSKPVHAQTEREVVDWQAAQEPIPYTRLAATVTDHEAGSSRPLELEILLTPRGDGLNFNKQVRINGVNKRSLDLIGLLRAVLFLPEDIKLVDGGPSERRRYLDIALCQIDPHYTRALAAYQKVLSQRNSLLKQLRDEGARPGAPAVESQLSFWDEKLVQHGSQVVAARHKFVCRLAPVAQARDAELSGGQEALDIEFIPSFNYGPWPDQEFELWQEGHLLDSLRWPWALWSLPEDIPIEETSDAPATPAPAGESVAVEEIRARFAAHLQERRARELAAGATLYGPHRDDMRFLANGRDLRAFGSRGQQRSAALSLKLAEVHVMTAATGSAPLLLLDDVMSELDAQRRSTLLATLAEVKQGVITTTDWDDFSLAFRREAQCLYVQAGTVTPAGEAALVNGEPSSGSPGPEGPG